MPKEEIKMTATISERHKEIMDRLRKRDAARKIIEGELLALQHECEHPYNKCRSGKDYSGFYSTDCYCPDCGLRTSS